MSEEEGEYLVERKEVVMYLLALEGVRLLEYL